MFCDIDQGCGAALVLNNKQINAWKFRNKLKYISNQFRTSCFVALIKNGGCVCAQQGKDTGPRSQDDRAWDMELEGAGRQNPIDFTDVKRMPGGSPAHRRGPLNDRAQGMNKEKQQG